jgi:predicted nucleic acid-binding protein
MKKSRLYIDTSVIGGCFEEQFAIDSLRVIQYAEKGKVHLFVSDTVVEELEGAPGPVKEMFQKIPPASLTVLPLTQDILDLRDAYLTSKILTPASRNDAVHVAAATVSGAEAIVSWNFKHIVQLGKMRAYNRVTRIAGTAF